MERLVTVKDVAERYGCSMPTARRYLRQMFHYENPLTAPRWAFDLWEESRETMPADIAPRQKVEILNRKEHSRVIVPRQR